LNYKAKGSASATHAKYYKMMHWQAYMTQQHVSSII